MKKIFICKPSTLEELRSELDRAAACKAGYEPEPCRVAAIRRLNTTEWNALTNGFLEDRDWIAAFSQRLENRPDADRSRRNCIKVTCEGQSISLLIDPQGYSYARYVAVMEN